jgi:cobalt-zinc-cadmium efflux system protein
MSTFEPQRPTLTHSAPHLHGREGDRRALARSLALVLGLMCLELAVGILSSSLALLSDAGHMLTDALALALSLYAARLASRPARGSMTFGLGRAEILSAQANGLTLAIVGALVIVGAAMRLISPPRVAGWPMLAVALAGIAVNLIASRLLHGAGERTLNVEGSYRHVLTDLFGFIATAAAAAAIIAGGLRRADAVASLLIACVMLHAAWKLLRASARVFMESAPVGLDPARIGEAMAREPGVVEVHDLHVWEVTSGFVSLSAHVVVRAGENCHELRRALHRRLEREFGIEHSTLQMDHEAALLQIERRSPGE